MNDQEFKDKYDQLSEKRDKEKEKIDDIFNDSIAALSREYLSGIAPFTIGDTICNKNTPGIKYRIKKRTWRRGYEQWREIYPPEWIYDCIELTKAGKERKRGGLSRWHHNQVEKAE